MSVYSEALGAAIVARLQAGESLRSICNGPGQPHRTTVNNWRGAHPEFDAAMAAAGREKRVDRRMRDRHEAVVKQAKPPARRGGSVSSYTPALGEAICARLANGESLTEIGRDPAMPCYGTILGWVRRHADFQTMYVDARAIQGDFLFDEARDVAREATRETVPVARLRFDVIRWQTARLAPKKYLERLVIAEEGAARAAERDEARAAREPVEVVFSAMHFEVGPDRRVLCAPPRNAEEAQAWVESTGRPYESGVGPEGQIRPPMNTPQDRAGAAALRDRIEADWTARRR